MRLGPDGRRRATLIGTFAAAVILAIMPFPVWAEPFRPDWVGLVLIYWCLAIPERVSVGTGWLLGFIQDILYGSLLGSNALAKTLVAFLAVRLHLQLRMFPRWQQAVSVLGLLVANQLLVLWIRGAIGQAPETISYWTPSVVGALLWPWLFVILRDLRRRGGIA
ncbi:MAG: rod shape-determining protein MreD [Gammaproteobacteria bacterium]|nr:rod shape-determining protein MreD [Gammaproteobacteria bacterium]MBI5782570.1 rod shape-determining protein MreD [Gammaproteobacteria bacterium]